MNFILKFCQASWLMTNFWNVGFLANKNKKLSSKPFTGVLSLLEILSLAKALKRWVQGYIYRKISSTLFPILDKLMRPWSLIFKRQCLTYLYSIEFQTVFCFEIFDFLSLKLASRPCILPFIFHPIEIHQIW